MSNKLADLRNKVIEVELEELSIIQKICEKHGLKFFAVCGTLLGAVRHNDLIPWDDDIDLAMPRDDYEAFVRFFPEENENEQFFLQLPKEDKDYYCWHAKLRNSFTTAIRKLVIQDRFGFNQGLFVAILPLDNVPDDRVMLMRHMKTMQRLNSIFDFGLYYYKSQNHSLVGRIAHVFSEGVLALHAPNRVCDAINKNMKKCNCDGTSRVAFIGQLYSDRFVFEKALHDDTIMIECENTYIPVPKRYNERLRVSFADLKTPVQANPEHGGVLFDSFVSYAEYISVRRPMSSLIAI